jgi:Holliday junction resolvasome RuvABC endonuclease subunit
MNTIFKILAFDPGLSNAGWVLISVNLKKDNITVLKAGTIQTSKIVNTVKYEQERAIFGARVVALGALEHTLYDMAEKYQPDFIVTEDAFYHPKRPAAYMALTQWITQLEMAMYRWRQPVFRIPTRLAKQCITSAGGAQKPDVQQALFSMPELMIKPKLKIVLKDPNVSDALAVGVTFIKMALPELAVQQKTVN